MLQDGTAEAYVESSAGAAARVATYNIPGQYFGEIALLTGGVRQATIVAAGTGCSVLSLHAEAFQDILAPVLDRLREGIYEYPGFEESR